MTPYWMPSKDAYGVLFRVVAVVAIVSLLGILALSLWPPIGLSDRTKQLIAWVAGGIVLAVVVVGTYISSKLGRWNSSRSTKATQKLPPIVIVIAIVGSVSPWLGIAVRLLTPRTWIVALVGAVLWSANCGGLWYLHRSPGIKGKRSLGVSILVWTIAFAPLFVASTAATAWVIRH